jgi:lipopolysaccharide biosynthesis regulator YciM
MDFDFQWLLLGLPMAFALGWLASRLDLRQWRKAEHDSPRAYFKGLNLLLNEQQDKAIDAFIEAVQHDPGSSDLHFALGNLFRRRGEYERAVRVHQHLMVRGDLPDTERHRAQFALAQDYHKAGLFDRAEQAFKALEGTDFATDARLAVLTLHERARDWKSAVEVARSLEAVAAGSFAQQISHYWCELAQEADARGLTVEAESALNKAREAAPQSPRPLVMAGQRLVRQGRHEEALALWTPLMTVHPGAFSVIAADYAAASTACGRTAEALEQLQRLQMLSPSSDVLAAVLKLQNDPDLRRELLFRQLQQQPTLTAAQGLLRELSSAQSGGAVRAEEWAVLQQAVTTAARPLQRYRCAACGFEAQQYFWQCPGCQGWETYPPRRLEDH